MSIIEVALFSVWLKNYHWYQNLYSRQKEHAVFVVSFFSNFLGSMLMESN
jgi:hypothetical protein